MSKKSKMNYGEKSVLDGEDMSMSKAKIRITTMIDMIIYEKLNEMADGSGQKYQTILNQILKNYFFPKNDYETTLPKEFTEMLERLSARIEKIEKKSKAG